MDKYLVNLIKDGGIAVIPTDTIYGIVGSALIPETVEKIYQLRKRSLNKPFIILISNLNDLNHFNIKLSISQKKFLKKIWPNPVSVILPCPDEKFKYLHRGTNSLAFRFPKDQKLVDLLKKVRPLVAPSANIEGERYAENIEEAKKYFGDQVSFYLDGDFMKSKPSTLIKLNTDGKYIVLRKGNYKIE